MIQTHLILKAGSVAGLLDSEKQAIAAASPSVPVFRRYFLSSASQKAEFPEVSGAASFIVQPPLDGSAVAVWLVLASDVEVESGAGFTLAREGECEHLWLSSLVAPGADSESQMRAIFRDCASLLVSRGYDLAEDCVRTWIHVGDIDRNYAGVVKARREFFETIGLTPDTHYIASTGINGDSCAPGALVQMDAYAVRGPKRQQYLYAPTHLNPTYEYGVTFERGVAAEVAGRRTVYISGTASIDNTGAVVHVGDVASQTLRMWENVEALLAEAGSGWGDVRQILVYLRNAADYEIVAPMFEAMFPDIPYLITLAPVCRPDWLIEMECVATLE